MENYSVKLGKLHAIWRSINRSYFYKQGSQHRDQNLILLKFLKITVHLLYAVMDDNESKHRSRNLGGAKYQT